MCRQSSKYSVSWPWMQAMKTWIRNSVNSHEYRTVGKQTSLCHAHLRCWSVLFQVNEFQTQSACELVRQHIDHGGVLDPDTYQWREVNNVTYLSSYNPVTSPATAKLSNRLLRHFALFSVSYPRWASCRSTTDLMLKGDICAVWLIVGSISPLYRVRPSFLRAQAHFSESAAGNRV